MAKISDFKGNWLKGPDLQGKEWLVTIDRVVDEQVGDDEKPKLVAYFVGRRKSLPLNQGNLGVLELAFGDDTENCRGGKVILYPENTRTPRGESAVGVRIKMPRAAAAPVTDATFVPNARERARQAEQQATQQSQLSDAMDDEIPF